MFRDRSVDEKVPIRLTRLNKIRNEQQIAEVQVYLCGFAECVPLLYALSSLLPSLYADTFELVVPKGVLALFGIVKP